jgi:hypothetical protein
MWAVLLGVVMVLVAVTSSRAALTFTAAHRPAAPLRSTAPVHALRR